MHANHLHADNKVSDAVAEDDDARAEYDNTQLTKLNHKPVELNSPLHILKVCSATTTAEA